MRGLFGIQGLAAAVLIATTSTAWASGNSLTSESAARLTGLAGAGKEVLEAAPIAAFYNPALAITSNGTAVSVSGTFLTATSDFAVTTNIGGTSTGKDFLPDAILGSAAITHRLTPDLAIGLTAGPAFGLSVAYPGTWSAAALVTDADLKQFAIAPTLAWRFHPRVTLGVAPIIEFGKLSYNSVTPFGPIQRDYDLSVAFGVLVGVYVTLPTETGIGLTYRLSPDHDFRGTRSGLLPSPSRLSIDSPDVASIGLRQGLTRDLDLLASVTWFGWSETRQHVIAEPAAGNTVIPRNWDDGWQIAIGFEYDVSPALSLRAGFAWSDNFIAANRRVPDAPFDVQKRYGVGLTYRTSPGRSWDMAYGYNDLGGNRLDLAAADYGGVAAQGTLEATGHVFSLQYNMQWGRTASEPVAE